MHNSLNSFDSMISILSKSSLWFGGSFFLCFFFRSPFLFTELIGC